MPVTKVKSNWVGGHLEFTEENDGRLILPNVVYQVRKRLAIAEINAGATVLPALQGFAYRMVDAAAIAVGGSVGATTGVDLMGTLSTGRKLVAFKTAGLTQSTLLRAGTATNGVILADGASFVANDPNTAITVIKDGSDLTTASHVDILLSYCIDPAS